MFVDLRLHSYGASGTENRKQKTNKQINKQTKTDGLLSLMPRRWRSYAVDERIRLACGRLGVRIPVATDLSR